MNRRNIVLSGLAAIFGASQAQENFRVEIIRDIQMPRDQIFDNAALWIAEFFRSSKAVIDLKDKEIGTIIGNGSFRQKIDWGATMPMTFKLRIDVRENRYRMTFSDVEIVTNFGTRPIESANRESLEPITRTSFEQMASSFHEYLSTAKERSW